MELKVLWKKIRRGIKYPILVLLIRCFTFIIRQFPRRFNLRLYRRLALLAYSLAPKMRNKITNNIRFAYGDSLPEAEVERIAKGSFVNQAWHFVDYVHTLKYTRREQFARLIDFVGEEHLQREYAKGKGVICLFNHCGPWELAVILPPVMGYETLAVSRALPNPRINNIIEGYRESRGMKNINRNGKAYPKLIEAIERGECIIIMIDQDTKVKGCYIDFMGHTAFTPVGAARMALDTQASVVPVHLIRKPDNRYEFRMYPAIETIRTGNLDDDLRQNTINYTAAIERFVREAPEQWTWMHDRWHTTPEIEQAWLEQHRAEKAAEAQRLAELQAKQQQRELRRSTRSEHLCHCVCLKRKHSI